VRSELSRTADAAAGYALSHRFDLVSSALGSRRKLLQTLSF
jgi:hypothetical protein